MPDSHVSTQLMRARRTTYDLVKMIARQEHRPISWMLEILVLEGARERGYQIDDSDPANGAPT